MNISLVSQLAMPYSIEKTEDFIPQNQKKEIKYPEFGQAIGNPYASNLMQRVVKVAAFVFAGGVLLVSGIVTSGLSAVFAAQVALIANAVYQLAKAVFRAYHSYRYRLAFEPGVNNPAAPKLGEYTKTDVRVSNHATESFEWKKALISSAQHSIEFSPNFAGGENFREVLQLIENQMTKYPDLKCHLILSSDLLEQQDREYLKQLKQFYPHFHYLITDRIYTTVPEILSEENHVKMLIVDGQYFAMGGTGIYEKMTREESPTMESHSSASFSSNFIDKAFRDTDIIGYGNVAQTMRNQFFNLYRIWEHRMTGADTDYYFATDLAKAGRCELFHEKEGLVQDTNLKYLVCGPEHRQKNPISSEIAVLAKGAAEDIKIANLLFNADAIVGEGLKEAKDKGISIQGYFNGTDDGFLSGHYLYALPNRYNYLLLTEVFEYKKKGQLYHKKVMTIDSRYTVIGGFNLGIKSAKCDYENVCVIDDSRVTQLMNAALKEDAAESDQLTGNELILKKAWSQIPSLLTIQALGNLFG